MLIPLMPAIPPTHSFCVSDASCNRGYLFSHAALRSKQSIVTRQLHCPHHGQAFYRKQDYKIKELQD
jgi:hypothetical protein